MRDDARDEAMSYGVDTIRLRISFPAAPAPQDYDDRVWWMRPLRGWTGGQTEAEASAGAEQGVGGAPHGAGRDGAGGSVTIPVGDRIPAASNEPATPVNPNAKVEALWAERAAITAEMDGLDAGGDYGRAATELHQRLENRRDIIDSNLRSQFSSSLSGTGLQEPGDLEAWLREQAEKAAGQPGAYDRMSAEEQRQFIRQHAPDYEIARTDEMARRSGNGGTVPNAGGGVPNVALKFDPNTQGFPVVLPDGSNVPDRNSPTGLLMSPYADLSNVAERGRRTGAAYFGMQSNPIRSAYADLYLAGQLNADLGHGGRFDYQRQGTPLLGYATGFTQSRQFRDVANFNVGLYMQQAGFTLDETLSTAGKFANLLSGNARSEKPCGLDEQTAEFIKIGYEAGMRSIFGPAFKSFY